ncbi:hypothetical protein [Labilithrix luteola]|nr:hypothetical protein [Labilithrix luteola]
MGFLQLFSGVSWAAESKAAEGKKAPEAKQAAEEPALGPRTVKIAVVLDKLTKFEIGPGTFNSEFFVFTGCDTEPCVTDPDVSNGKVVSKEKVADLPTLKIFRVKAELEANVDLSEFPFDKHTLPITLTDKDDDVTYVSDPALLTQFKMPSVNPEIRLAGWNVDTVLMPRVVTHKLEGGLEFKEASFDLPIARPVLASFFKTLVPVFFMIFVAGFTLLLKAKSAAGRLTAATGGLMTVVMFHLSATSSLPPLGYLTRMDKFMLATYFVYLVNIFFAVAIVRFDEKKNEKFAELAYLIAGGAVPGLALVAWLSVFLKVV